MTEPRFVPKPAPMVVADIAALTGAEAIASAPLDRLICGVAQLDRAGPTDLTFLDHPKYADLLPTTRAGCCLIAERFIDRAPGHVALLRSREPYKAFVNVARRMFAEALRPSSLFAASGSAPGAI